VRARRTFPTRPSEAGTIRHIHRCRQHRASIECAHPTLKKKADHPPAQFATLGIQRHLTVFVSCTSGFTTSLAAKLQPKLQKLL
jgi:hypothetical protein